MVKNSGMGTDSMQLVYMILSNPSQVGNDKINDRKNKEQKTKKPHINCSSGWKRTLCRETVKEKEKEMTLQGYTRPATGKMIFLFRRLEVC